MALNLLKAGNTLFVSSRSRIPAAFAAQGATICTNATEVAKRA
ncbi:MAG: 2-hydroxy-3-oxopropionate reductase, partial [Hydrogenophaga sp.]|nr:2-hydroxy-3-oxopropionate reductase [Hydrogenophaga sp.]